MITISLTRNLLIFSIIGCIMTVATHIVKYEPTPTNIISDQKIKVVQIKNIHIDSELAEHIFSTKQSFLHINDIAEFYTPLYTVATQIATKEYKKQFITQMMQLHDLYNKCNIKAFGSKYTHLPLTQQKYIIERIQKTLASYCTENNAEQDLLANTNNQMNVIAQAIIQTKQYAKEMLVLAQKRKFGPLSFIKFAFNAIKMAF